MSGTQSFGTQVSVALTGVPPATLQQWLAQAQQALADMMTGRNAVTVSYQQGQGQRSVTYNRANIADLRAWIIEIQAALGQGRRRAILPVFR